MQQAAPYILVCDCGSAVEVDYETFENSYNFTCEHCLEKIEKIKNPEYKAEASDAVYISECRNDAGVDAILKKLKKISGKSFIELKKFLEENK
jgi:hypothetical protein